MVSDDMRTYILSNKRNMKRTKMIVICIEDQRREEEEKNQTRRHFVLSGSSIQSDHRRNRQITAVFPSMSNLSFSSSIFFHSLSLILSLLRALPYSDNSCVYVLPLVHIG